MGHMPCRVAGWSTGALAWLVAWPLLVGAAPVPTDERQAEAALSAVVTHEPPTELAWPDLGPADPVTTPGTLTVDVETVGHRFAALTGRAAGEAGEGTDAALIEALSIARPEAPVAVPAASSPRAGDPSWQDWAGLALAALVVAGLVLVAVAVAVLRPSSSPQAG